MIPTTKHHDGVALWDAPGTGARNTVHRGPRRDLVGEIADAGKRGGPQSLHRLCTDHYAAVPDGVVDDRWGTTHHDFVTSEYEHNRHVEGGEPWENNRGIGFSFGHNTAEDESRAMDGRALTRYLTDIVSRGGRLLLNVGPTAEGVLPGFQQRALEGLGRRPARRRPARRLGHPVRRRPGPGPAAAALRSVPTPPVWSPTAPARRCRGR